jgi:hypothetical protein
MRRRGRIGKPERGGPHYRRAMRTPVREAAMVRRAEGVAKALREGSRRASQRKRGSDRRPLQGRGRRCAFADWVAVSRFAQAEPDDERIASRQAGLVQRPAMHKTVANEKIKECPGRQIGMRDDRRGAAAGRGKTAASLRMKAHEFRVLAAQSVLGLHELAEEYEKRAAELERFLKPRGRA